MHTHTPRRETHGRRTETTRKRQKERKRSTENNDACSLCLYLVSRCPMCSSLLSALIVSRSFVLPMTRNHRQRSRGQAGTQSEQWWERERERQQSKWQRLTITRGSDDRASLSPTSSSRIAGRGPGALSINVCLCVRRAGASVLSAALVRSLVA